MAKVVLVSIGENTRRVTFSIPESSESTPVSDTEALVQAIRVTFTDILQPDQNFFLQIKSKEWGGEFIDLLGNQKIPEKSIIRAVVKPVTGTPPILQHATVTSQTQPSQPADENRFDKQVEDAEPLPRWGHLAVTLGSKAFLWGGEGSTTEDRRFLWVFDMHTKKWSKMETKGAPPQGFVACAYTLIGSVLYIFGGSDGQSYYNHIYQIELSKSLVWKKCKVQNPDKAPMKKRSTGMIARKTKDGSDELVVFGGYGAPRADTQPGSTIHRTNEVHTFNIEKGEWSAQDATHRISIPEWDSFTITKVDNDHAIVLAGVQQGPGAISDVYCLQMEYSRVVDDPEWSWVKLAVTGGSGVPSARRDHATTLLGTGKYPQLFMTGGIDRNWRSLGDAWILNLEREADGKISQGSWLKFAGQIQDSQINDTDSAEPLTPRYSLTANKFENNGYEQQLYLMLFGGITSENKTIAETTILTLDYSRDFKQKITSVYKP